MKRITAFLISSVMTPAALTAGEQWYQDQYGANYNGQVTLQSPSGSITALSNPTGANVMVGQSASVQPPVVIVQATGGGILPPSQWFSAIDGKYTSYIATPSQKVADCYNGATTLGVYTTNLVRYRFVTNGIQSYSMAIVLPVAIFDKAKNNQYCVKAGYESFAPSLSTCASSCISDYLHCSGSYYNVNPVCSSDSLVSGQFFPASNLGTNTDFIVNGMYVTPFGLVDYTNNILIPGWE